MRSHAHISISPAEMTPFECDALAAFRQMPLVVVLLGVFGGILAFGFMGLFLGPTLLAVAYSLIGDWIEQPTREQSALPPAE